jgi:hypothetical protein
MFSDKIDGILCIIAAFLLQFIVGAKYAWANLNPYFASYLYYSGDKDIRPKDTYFLMPCLDGVIYLFLTIGVKLGDRIVLEIL